MHSPLSFMVLGSLLLACVGEVGSLAGSPCESDLDCPGAARCEATTIDGTRRCHALEAAPTAVPTYCDVKPVLDATCNACHGESFIGSGTSSMRFDLYEDGADGRKGAKSSAHRIAARTFDSRDMPPLGATMPTDAERALIGDWFAGGALPCPEEGADGGMVDGETDAGTTTPPPPVDAGTPVSYEADIQPIWNQHCASCHQGGDILGGLDLAPGRSHAELVNQPTGCNPAVPLVKPQDLQGSMLWRKLAGDPTRCNNVMPTAGALKNVAPEAMEKVEAWILQGAKQ